MTQTPEQIAAGLSYAEAAAVRGVYAWASPWDQYEGEARLYQLGIWTPNWTPKPKYRASILTPLGQQVHAILEKNNERG